MRTIDVDHFLGTLKSVVERNGSEEWRKIANTMAYMIETESTLCGKDIVMCGDCTRYEKKNGRCNLVEGLNVATANSFCSYAERRQKNG